MSNGVPCLWMAWRHLEGRCLPWPATCRPIRRRETLSCCVRWARPIRRQIDGLGGGDPLTSKVAVVSRSGRPGVDVDYLFLQIFVDEAIVSDTQNCGNMLAAVGPFAIERGLVAATDPATRVTIFMINTGQTAVATVMTPGGVTTYDGKARIRRRAGYGGAGPARVFRHGRVDLRRAAAHRQRHRRLRRRAPVL